MQKAAAELQMEAERFVPRQQVGGGEGYHCQQVGGWGGGTLLRAHMSGVGWGRRRWGDGLCTTPVPCPSPPRPRVLPACLSHNARCRM